MTISIKGLEINATHGVFESEKKVSQKFIFDIDLLTDCDDESDELSKTVDYGSVCTLIEKIATGNCFNLIEKLARECAFAVLENYDRVQEVYICVHKPDAPIAQKAKDISVSLSLKRVEAYLSLGSSMGDKKGFLDKAISLLKEVRGVKVQKVSEYIESEPYGNVAKNKFLNCAVQISTFLPPHALLDELQKIENALGRVRKIHWEDRTLDIDIIFYGDEKICDERLTVPHPDYKNRDFVLIPLKSIAPHKLT